MREDDLYYFLLESSFGLSMAALWQHMRVQLSSSGYGFYEQSDMFFRLLAWLIEQGKIKLACDGEFLSARKKGTDLFLRSTRRTGKINLSPCPLVPLSPCPLVPLSPCPLVPFFPFPFFLWVRLILD